ncbi:iron dependent repressor, metal binding and dimerization domain protein [Clostridium sp. KNHs214]|uniref:metal-dependent transcriptional regulator n=1 Tax=Clostridium sp. KNHs214 TaxID=1540257 RepID=UPI00055760B3|nr:iron dependent repressor, metal binding and dimerization domain protein [Clostridium sp. KNHs214]
MAKEEFFTFRQYMQKEGNALTASAEDYLEMVYRLSFGNGYTRIGDLAEALNVQPPSVTKMIQKLAEIDLVKYEKYGIVVLSDKGKTIGKFLLDRHNTIERFLSLLQVSEVLDETEKIEHTIDDETLLGIKKLVKFFEDNEEIKTKFISKF